MMRHHSPDDAWADAAMWFWSTFGALLYLGAMLL